MTRYQGKESSNLETIIADYLAARTAKNELRQILHKPLERQLWKSWHEVINTVSQKYRIKETGQRESETREQM